MIKDKELVATAYTGKAAKTYDDLRFTTKQGLLFDTLEWEELKKVAAVTTKAGSVLELGCGTARFSKRLAELGFRVRAVDPSAQMIQIAAEKCKDLDHVTFAQEQATALSSNDCTFDLVFAIRVTNQTESKEYALRMVREMVRVAKPGGLILIEFTNSRRPLKRKSDDVRLAFSEISKVGCKSGCRIESRRGILVFSKSVMDRMPGPLIPLWAIIERLSARFFWRWASRGYILLRK